MIKDDEIFTDLLDKDVDDNDIEFTTTTEPVYILQSCDLILNVTGNPIDFCVTSDFVAITTDDGTQYKTSLYLTKDITDSTDLKTEQIRYLTLQKQSNHGSNNTAHKQVCMKIVSADVIAQPNFFNSSDVVKIEDYMFKHLFGHDTSLLSSPVILIGPTEGDLFFVPIKYFVSDSSQPMVGVHTNKDRASQFGWRLFCQITGCVADIFSLPMKSKSDINEDFAGSLNDNKKQDALVIYSRNGSVLVYHKTTKHKNDTSLKASRLNIIDPVLCLCSFHNTIFHSTGRSVYRNGFDIKAVVGKFKVTNVSTKVINKANVVGLQLQLKEGVVNLPGTICILNYLLKNSNRACGRINCTEYAAVTMLGQPVYLNVQEHDVDDTVTTSTEASRHLSVSVRCDCATSAAMNEAILRRLMKIKDVSNPSPVLLKDMREKLQSLQELEEHLNEMQQIRQQSRQPSSTVEVVYQKLRNLNL